MTTPPPDLKKLRELAERAISPGEEWYDAWQMRQILMHEARVNEPALSGDVAFITEITPQVVLALLDAYEASARDAERYRWLRDVANPDAEVSGISVQEQCFNSWGKTFQTHYSGQSLDEAIDAARHATQGD